MAQSNHSAHKVKKKHSAKQVTLHHHHAKPYRKSHLSLLLVSLAGFLITFVLLIQYRDQVMVGVTSSQNFVADLFASKDSGETTVSSTYGFSLQFDAKKLYGIAVDGQNGKVYRDASVKQELPYTTVQLAPYSIPQVTDQSTFSLNYHAEISKTLSSVELRTLALKDGDISSTNVQLVDTKKATIGGHTFEQTIWQTKATSPIVKNLKSSFSIYTATVAGHPVTITLSEGFVATPGSHPQYDAILESIRFGVASASNTITSPVATNHIVPSILDTILQSKVAAAAASTDTASAPQKIAALYSPAVAKIYNIYCVDIKLDDKPLYKDVCDGGSGSSFFVSRDGYMATNGHVAMMDAKNLAVQTAANNAAVSGDLTDIAGLAVLGGLKESDTQGITEAKKLAALLLDKAYSISDSRFALTNDVQNMFVELTDKQPDVERLLDASKNREKYTLDSSMAAATTKAINYRSKDGIDGWRSSDVAIVKIDGNNFPVAHLGSFDDVTQGDNISILGFPGQASENGVVDSTTTTATLTNGKVSSKKKAAGSDKWLIETDTTIGHGNSGGPVFADGGKVVGIATYTVDGSGSGNGTYNYIRDIKDLKDLAASKSITFDTNSEVQAQWEQGMQYFYTAHYSKALPYFDKVKQLYPNHNKVAEFTATAQKRIADGQDVKDFPVVEVSIAAAVLLVGVGVAVVLIVRHRKKRAIYQLGVAQGTVNPMTPGSSSQTVSVTPATVQPVVAQQPLQPAPSVNLAQPPATPTVPPTTVPPTPIASPTTIPVSSPVTPVSTTTPPVTPPASVAPVAPSQPQLPTEDEGSITIQHPPTSPQ